MFIMYILNGIAFAGEQKKLVTVISARPLNNYQLWLRFSTGETKVFDFSPLLETEVFKPLKDKSIFDGVYIDYGIPVWNDGAIDISPEYLYQNGSSA